MTIRVLMIVENRPAPIDTRVWTEALTLRDQGFEVSVISPRGPKDATSKQSNEEDMNGIHLYTYRLPQFASGILAYLIEYTLSMFQTWWLSLFILCKHGFDVIHVANPPDTFFLLGIFYHLFGKRFIFDQHDLAPELFKVKFGDRHPILYKILLWLLRRSYEIADLTITTNESQKDLAIQRGCNPEKVVIVRNGPVLEHFSRVPADPQIKNERPFLLVYVGGMEKQDGIEYALRAMYELIYIYKRQDVSLALLGNGNALPKLEELRRELHLEAYVTFTGWEKRETVIRYLSTADIGLCPDPCNGLNEYSTTIKSMEYMALSLPIVAFDLEETRATACEAALYAAPNSSQDFARKIVHLLENPELRALMGQFARARVETYLSWDHSRPNLLLAYATLFNDSLALALPEQGKASLDGSI